MNAALAGTGFTALRVVARGQHAQWRHTHVQPGIGPMLHLVMHMLMAGLTWHAVEHVTRSGHWVAGFVVLALAVVAVAAFVLRRNRIL
ncbi:hypothetical protein G4X40_02110 [Rhodococcus sp. D2-41]|uniref:Uncharacterized protein n=1 Tax=Speluncibacter jeojiensis TaxID=2710754 RepID=A0A9X4M1Z8_9ACTN|nr:hypothetical protein [Rhodococcus sp. D2-41]MDG3008938.1 hypothetical protein [Rhodococcus sp. D2-41]MDG3016560.1 hypothetical protein [Corynebacteriales bacterium D3-21]